MQAHFSSFFRKMFAVLCLRAFENRFCLFVILLIFFLIRILSPGSCKAKRGGEREKCIEAAHEVMLLLTFPYSYHILHKLCDEIKTEII